ncbi:hypothetical protein BaRGS_00028309 [Batillaria attramentaria]|uniref:Uncharacterized protein n=1 Tax=Batillaria attramentaria TaxID=370345 RepID=A0ABD0K082_9CAEN
MITTLMRGNEARDPHKAGTTPELLLSQRRSPWHVNLRCEIDVLVFFSLRSLDSVQEKSLWREGKGTRVMLCSSVLTCTARFLKAAIKLQGLLASVKRTVFGGASVYLHAIKLKNHDMENDSITQNVFCQKLLVANSV